MFWKVFTGNCQAFKILYTRVASKNLASRYAQNGIDYRWEDWSNIWIVFYKAESSGNIVIS